MTETGLRAVTNKSVLDYVLGEFYEIAETYREQAEARFSLHADDPIAKLYERNAKEIEDKCAILSDTLQLLTPDQYAQLNGVTRWTVRRWIKEGKLSYIRDAKGYKIPRNERPKK